MSLLCLFILKHNILLSSSFRFPSFESSPDDDAIYWGAAFEGDNTVQQVKDPDIISTYLPENANVPYQCFLQPLPIDTLVAYRDYVSRKQQVIRPPFGYIRIKRLCMYSHDTNSNK